jgi:hypothetical protein
MTEPDDREDLGVVPGAAGGFGELAEAGFSGPWVETRDSPRTVGVDLRLSAGVGWEWREGAVRVWEAGADDLAALPDQLRAAWRFLSGLDDALQIMQDWPPLDQATVLLGSLDGELRYARVYRHRRDARASFASVLPFYDEPEQAVADRGFRAWARLVGYEVGSIFVSREQFEHPVIQANIARLQPQVLQRGEDSYELDFDFREPAADVRP